MKRSTRDATAMKKSRLALARPEERIPPPKTPTFDLVFFAMADSCVRIRGGEHGMYGMVRQVTYRCGSCFAPVIEAELVDHFDEHRKAAGR